MNEIVNEIHYRLIDEFASGNPKIGCNYLKHTSSHVYFECMTVGTRPINDEFPPFLMSKVRFTRGELSKVDSQIKYYTSHVSEKNLPYDASVTYN